MLRKIKAYLYSNFFYCIISAGLLILAFPRADLRIFAWCGLIPLMVVLDGKKSFEAFRWAYLCGLLFFSGVFFWFFYLTQWFAAIAVLGVVLLLLYLSLYFGIFGLCYCLFSRQKPLFKLFLLPSVWVVLEFIRGYLFTGFGWAKLGHSQYTNLPIIQIADLTGVYGVSFIIVMINVALKELLTAKFKDKSPQSFQSAFLLMGTSVVTLLLCLGYGMFQLSLPAKKGPKTSVAVIQANIPQILKWQKSAWPAIMDKYVTLTEEAAKQNPDLIIWPETSYPGHLWEDKSLFIHLQELVQRINIPLVYGSVLLEENNYYNSAMMMSTDGNVSKIYRKIHLVPFGEFLPLRSILPFLSKLVDIGDFKPGDQWTTFAPILSKNGNEQNRRLSVLICFEDTVARLSRHFVRNGAKLLVNITNDAWFGNTKAPFMHLQASVFRTIENRRGLIRAANAGVSCFIDRWGRITKYVELTSNNKSYKTYISGFGIENVDFNDQMTYYTKFGDVFTILCFGCILMGIIKLRTD